MTEPVSFTAQTPRHGLPLLFAGQAEKEFFVNESLARLALLLHPVVLGEADAPPPSPIVGECWIVGPAPTGSWSGQAKSIAGWDGSQWSFAQPTPGLAVHDLAAGSQAVYNGGWLRSSRPAAPTGGAVVDVEARDLLATLLDALVRHGIFPAG